MKKHSHSTLLVICKASKQLIYMLRDSFHIPESVLHYAVLARPPTGTCMVALKYKWRLLTTELGEKAAALHMTHGKIQVLYNVDSTEIFHICRYLSILPCRTSSAGWAVHTCRDWTNSLPYKYSTITHGRREREKWKKNKRAQIKHWSLHAPSFPLECLMRWLLTDL